MKGNKDAVAETIENNVRSKIIKEHLNDPAFYEKMSALLDEIIADRRRRRIEYEEYLKRIAELAKQVEAGKADDTPEKLNTPGKRALYNNLKKDEALALKIDETVRRVRPDGWRGNQAKENVIKAALLPLLGNDGAEVERIFLIIKAQTRILMVTQIQLGDIAVDVCSKGHQERPSERLSADRPGAHFRPAAHEPRHHPRLRHFQAGLDQAAAEESCGSRSARRRASTWTGKATTSGASATC